MKKINLALFIIIACLISCNPKNDPTNETQSTNGTENNQGEGETGVYDGSFSVSSTKKVTFASGNLQYQPSTKTWRFAEHQYDVTNKNYDDASGDTTTWRDHLAWSVSVNNYGTEWQENEQLHFNDTVFVDWGKVIGTEWFTLSWDEWKYMAEKRQNASKLWGLAYVNEVYGLILLPDYCTIPSPLTFNCGNGAAPATALQQDILNRFKLNNSYTATEWSQLESLGALFLPIDNENSAGGTYWTSSLNKNHATNNMLQYAHTFSFWHAGLSTFYSESQRDMGNFVRLAKLHK